MSHKPDVVFDQLGNVSDPLAARLFEIYTDSFPPQERGEFTRLLAGLESKQRFLIVAYAFGELAAFASIVPFCQNLLFLSYFAVAVELRNKGIGGELFQHVATIFRAERWAKGIIFEVDAPNVALSSELLLRQRRIEFYKRNGAILLDDKDAYCAPNHAGAGGIPMKLMWLQLNGESPILTSYTLKHYITCLYRELYRRGPEDQLLKSILRNFS